MELLLFLLNVLGVSLSGALAPGPVTAAAIGMGSRNRFAGVLMALGHGAVEFPLMVLLIFGVGRLLTLPAISTAIGLIGLTIGLGLGYGISVLLRAYAWPLDPKVYMIDHLPIDVRSIDYVACAVIAFGICLVATLIPSWRAARMRPVDGLHYE